MQRNQTVLEYGWLFTDKPPANAEAPGIDDSGWQTVSIPHDWAVSRPFNKDMAEGNSQGYFDRWGIGYYRYTLQVPAKKEHHKYLLTFDGIFEDSTVWVNGQKAGGRLYGYSGFTLDVTGLVEQGDNLIAVRADNSKGPVDRWYSGAGLYREVRFTEVFERHFDELELVVTTELSSDFSAASLTVNTGLQGASIKAELSYDGKTVAQSGSDSGILTLEVSKPKLWSADNPHLYALKLLLTENGEAVDEISLSVGIRKVVFDSDKGMLINGRPEKLKGVCLHQDISGAGIAVTKSLLRQRLETLKTMGCNAIRTSHNTPQRELLELCDEMGFYLIDEAFDKWDTGAYGRYFATEWERDLGFMVKRDRNHACVVIWSVGNEVDAQGSTHMLEILKKLAGYTKALDSTRPVTVALSPHYSNYDGVEQFDIDKILNAIVAIADCVDILALNYQEQWYQDIRALRPEKLIVGSETYVFFRGSRDHYFNFSTENPWMDVERNDFALGGFLWPGIDYLGESREYPCKGWCNGPISSYHGRKPLFYLFESYWSDQPMVHITIQDYTLKDHGDREHWGSPMLFDCWNFPMYVRTPIPYMIFTNCDEVRLSLNGKYFDIKKPSECESRIITGFLPMDAGTVKAEGYINGQKICEHNLITSKEAMKLVFDTPKVEVSPDTRQHLFTVRALDRDGIPVVRESAEVRFVVEGDADIFCVDSGDMTNLEPFAADRVHLYHGAAAIMLRMRQGASGRIVVTAMADGMYLGKAELLLKNS